MTGNRDREVKVKWKWLEIEKWNLKKNSRETRSRRSLPVIVGWYFVFGSFYQKCAGGYEDNLVRFHLMTNTNCQGHISELFVISEGRSEIHFIFSGKRTELVINGWLRFAPGYKHPDKGINWDFKRFKMRNSSKTFEGKDETDFLLNFRQFWPKFWWIAEKAGIFVKKMSPNLPRI